MHGEFTTGYYSWSTGIYAQGDYSLDVFTTDYRGAEASIIVTRDFGAAKFGASLGALMIEDQNIYFSAGLIGMAQLGGGTYLQGEIGAYTDGEDGQFFADNTYFAQVRLDHEITSEWDVYAKYGRVQNDTFEVDRGLVGVTYSATGSPWMLSGGVGAYRVDGTVYPAINAEFKFAFGGETLPQPISGLAARPFDKFEIFEFSTHTLD